MVRLEEHIRAVEEYLKQGERPERPDKDLVIHLLQGTKGRLLCNTQAKFPNVTIELEEVTCRWCEKRIAKGLNV
jgi:hypothetical protein